MSGRGNAAAGSPWRKRGDMILRILAALPLGYAVATLWAIALSVTLPMRPEQATTVGMLAAFAICAVAAMWAFAARSGWKAIWVLAVAGGVAAALTWIVTRGGGVA